MKKHFSKNPYPVSRFPQPVNRALTLVELLVAGAIVGVVFLGIISMFLAGQKSFTNTSQQAIVQHKANLVMEYIIKGIRQRGGVDLEDDGTFPVPLALIDGRTNVELYTLWIDKDASEAKSNGDEQYKYWLVDSVGNLKSFKKCTFTVGTGCNGTEETITQIEDPDGNVGLEFMYCVAGSTNCVSQGEGVQIKVTSGSGRDYISKVPYSY